MESFLILVLACTLGAGSALTQYHNRAPQKVHHHAPPQPAPVVSYHSDHHEEDEDHHTDYYSPPHYNFEYSVHDGHTGDVKSAHETREGDVVKGFYAVKEADGTIREVHYTADHKNGFNAEVKRTGHAVHPALQAVHHPAPAGSKSHIVYHHPAHHQKHH